MVSPGKSAKWKRKRMQVLDTHLLSRWKGFIAGGWVRDRYCGNRREKIFQQDGLRKHVGFYPKRSSKIHVGGTDYVSIVYLLSPL